MADGTPPAVVVWAPQKGPQSSLLTCPIFEVFYGGARGGGKTDGMLGEWAVHAGKYGEHAVGVFFRRELTQLDEAIERSKQIYSKLGADWSEQKKQWSFRNGARLKFRYLDRDTDAENYQGHSYTRVYFEELTNFPDSGPVMKLKATLRSANAVPCRFRATGNPGGPGHHWVRARYIDPAPHGYKVVTEDCLSRVFIPSKLSDNPKLTDSDPTYVNRLKQSGSEKLVAAWLDGDWSVIEGAFFSEWSSKLHVLQPFGIPASWHRFRSFDWGSAKPFSVGWWAIVEDDTKRPEGNLPRGAMVRYREWYGAKAPNVGLKMTAEEVASGIVTREKGDTKKTMLGVADPSIFAEDGGPSIAERMYPAIWTRADNRRVAAKGALGGWDQLRSRLKGEGGRPMIYTFSTCIDSIRTIPLLQHDKNKAEDLDSDAEDHAGDEWRYACMSRPYKPRVDASVPARKDSWGKAFTPIEENSWKVA